MKNLNEEKQEYDKVSIFEWLYINSDEIFDIIDMIGLVLLGAALIIFLIALAVFVFIKAGTMI